MRRIEAKELSPTKESINPSPDILLVLPPLYHTGREPDYNPKEPMNLWHED